MIDVVVIGNACLDVLFMPVDDVPRYDSMEIPQAHVGTGGCASNVAVGLAVQGFKPTLIACMGDDHHANLLVETWRQAGVDTRFVRRITGQSTGLTLCLVDNNAVPRFLYTPGVNDSLSPGFVDLSLLVSEGVRALHIAGHFLMPGMLDDRLVNLLAEAKDNDIMITVDVALHHRMSNPAPLWMLLPFVDVFLANEQEADRLTGLSDPVQAADYLRKRGAKTVIIKLGSAGCYVLSDSISKYFCLPVEMSAFDQKKVVDSTGAGDAFAAGLVGALLQGVPLEDAVPAACAAGYQIVTSLGAISGWFQ